MDQTRFGVMTRMMRRIPSRRDVLRGLVGVGLGLGSPRLPNVATAKKKRKKKIKRNDFGCVNVGGFCKNKGQCCSGICKGKKGRKRCKAHDTGGCTGEQDTCAGVLVPCQTATGEDGGCMRTTGNAGYCNGGGGACFPCKRDTDCEAVCGPQAACIVCELECGPNGTACVGPSVDSCEFPEGSAPSPSTGAAPARITRNRSR